MFESVIGQDRLKAQLSGAMAKNQISHAYLLVGARGIGKRFFAMQLAQGILCTAPDPTARPCGHCLSCEHFATDTHPDFVRVAPQEGARTIKIAQIRQMIATAARRTYDGGNRVFLIEHGETMTTESQNALLKSLEEPEAGNVFLVLTDNLSKILPTIRSRCQQLTFEPLTSEQMAQVAARVAPGLSARERAELIRRAEGLPGKLAALANGEDDEILNRAAADAVCDILSGDLTVIFDVSKKIAAVKNTVPICEYLIAVVAAALEAHYGAKPETPEAKKLSRLASADKLIAMQSVLFELSRRLAANVNVALQWEAALLKISEV